MLDLKIGKELQSKRDSRCRLYRAVYDGCKCYAVIDNLSEFVMIFEDSKVYQALVQKLKCGWRINFSRRNDGKPFFCLYKRIHKKSKHVELTRFVAERYEGKPLEGFNVKPFDDGRLEDNFLDFRRYNVSLPGFDLRHRKDMDYKVLPCPVHDEEKHIHIIYKDGEHSFEDVVSYERELDTMLKTPKYCNFYPKGSKRGTVSVGGGDSICSLSKFAAIYKYYFGPYRGMEDGIERFIKDFKSIRQSLPDNTEVEHLNCNRNLNTFDNLMLVDGGLNQKKRQYINWFAGEYGVHPIVNDADEILLAYDRLNLITGEQDKRYYKCKTFPDFVDWILLYLGKDAITEKLQVRYNPMIEDEQTVILTPAGMIVDGIVNQTVAGNNVVSLEEHIHWRDTLLALPDEAFTVHEWGERTPEYTINLVLDMIGASES